MHERIGPVLIKIKENFASTFLVKIASGRQLEAEQAARHIWKQYIPEEPFDYHFLDMNSIVYTRQTVRPHY